MQLITSGTTRVVVLVGPFAIKLARFKIFFVCRRTWQILSRREYAQKAPNWKATGGGTFRVVFRLLFAGMIANRCEYRLANKAARYELARTYFTLGYIVNVQERGECAITTDVSRHPVTRAAMHRPELKLDLRGEQFCIVRGIVRLADYGSVEFAEIIT